jgi:hypothetical protein
VDSTASVSYPPDTSRRSSLVKTRLGLSLVVADEIFRQGRVAVECASEVAGAWDDGPEEAMLPEELRRRRRRRTELFVGEDIVMKGTGKYNTATLFNLLS